MKNGYKYILTIAGIIAAVGVVICLTGAISAKISGVTLFSEKSSSGDYVHTHDFTEENISRISIDVTDADINIIGGSDKSYIELVNFNENYYAFRVTDRIIEFKEYQDFLSSFKFWENDGGFKGMRYILRIKRYPEDKKVNIYLKDDSSLKNLNLEMEQGHISIENVSGKTDYIIKEVTNGTVSISNISNASSVKLSECDECSMTLNNVAASYVNLNSALLKLKGDNLSFKSGEINISNGSIDLGCTISEAEAGVDIKTSGSLTVNKKEYTSKYTEKENGDIPTSSYPGGKKPSGDNKANGLFIDGGNSIININYSISGNDDSGENDEKNTNTSD